MVKYGGGGGASARWFRYSWITLLALLVLSVTGYGAYRVLKPWRARNLARQAEQAFRQRDFARSQATMRAALRMGPADPEVLHITAQLLSSAGSIEGLEFWRRFFSVHVGSEADQLSYLDVALRFNRVDLAWPALNTLIRLRTNDVSLLHRGVRLMLQADDPGRAEPWARLALRLNPAAVSNQLVLGEVLFLAANPVKNAEGQRLLLPLALGHGAEQPFAATLLADQANLGQAERRQIAQALRDHGPTNATTRLLVAQLSLPVERPARDAALAQVVREFGGDDSLRAPLAAWFFRRGEAASALTILPLDRCITNPPWLHARLEALVRAGAWGELGTTLTRPNLPLSPLRQFTFTAQQFAGTGHPVEAAANFQQALQNAKPEPLVPDPLRWLANQAESAGLPASAAAAWEQRMRNPRATVTSGREAVRLLTPLNEEVRLRAVLR